MKQRTILKPSVNLKVEVNLPSPNREAKFAPRNSGNGINNGPSVNQFFKDKPTLFLQ